MSISLYLIPPPRTEFRMLATIISAFEGLGIKDAASRIAAVRSWDSMTILVRNSPFAMDEIERIKTFCEDRRFDLVYYPGIKEGESNKYIKMPSDEYFIGFNKILNNKMRTPFLDYYLFDIKPVHDDNPFFHYYLKIDNVKAIYAKMGRKWLYFLEEGYFLPIVFVIILFLSVLLIIFPVYINAIKKRRIQRFKHFEHVKPSSSFFVFIYFALLGLGFMFVEVSLIQKSILLLENPSYSIAVILTAILISSGTGSMISANFSESRTSFSLLILSLLILIYSLIHPVLLTILSPYTLKVRIIAITFSIIPLGLFMGIPFPLGIKLLGHNNEALIPWAWAINSCLSVLAPIMTIMLALIFGFKAVFWIGTLAYFLAFLSLTKLIKMWK